MAPLYRPPVAVVTCQTPYLSLVSQADPQWAQRKYWDIEYLTDHRPLFANSYERGAYNRLSNTYGVGQQYGGLDPLVEAALAPTVGNDVLGLYEAVPTGGWA